MFAWVPEAGFGYTFSKTHAIPCGAPGSRLLSAAAQ